MVGWLADDGGWLRPRRVLLVAGFASAVTPVLVVAVLAAALFTLPPARLPPERRSPGVSRIYAADGTLIAALGAFERFVPVAQDDVPSVLKEAVVAIEDRRFYSHNGVDFRAVIRAFWTNLNHSAIVQGGSTITQQYVKQAYMTGSERTLRNKVHEAIRAAQAERSLSKDEILHRYLSTVYFGSGAYGVGAAAETYFRKRVGDLSLSEAALLAGLMKAPTALNPRSNPIAAERRRRVVLDKMHEQGRIGETDYQSALDAPVRAFVPGEEPLEGATLVFPAANGPNRYPYFVDYVRRYLVARFGEDMVSDGGLRVETSLDTRLQALAESTVASALDGTDPPLEMSLVSVHPQTGLVRALVGGRDYERSQVNLALGNCAGVDGPDSAGLCLTGGGSGRQPGSAFKPFVLARALEEGIPLTRTYPAPSRYRFPSCRGRGCTVENASGGYGRITLRQATADSVNTVFAQLITDVGVEDTAALAHRLGATSIRSNAKLPNGESYGPSLALGAAEVSPLGMAAAYAVFANRGVRLPVAPVVKVTTSDGEVLEDNTSRRGRRVLAAPVADKVTNALEDVIAHGTGTAADVGIVGAAGKTGTSENYSDAWFVGFTPTLSTAVWMGYADSQRPLIDIDGFGRVYGGTIPARTWATFTEQALSEMELNA